jgi:hypothetical protein
MDMCEWEGCPFVAGHLSDHGNVDSVAVALSPLMTTDQKLDLVLSQLNTLTTALGKVAKRFPLLGLKL